MRQRDREDQKESDRSGKTQSTTREMKVEKTGKQEGDSRGCVLVTEYEESSRENGKRNGDAARDESQ